MKSISRTPFPPIEPPATRVRFPDPLRAPSHGVLAVGCDFTPGTLLLAYRSGIFPWPHGEEDEDVEDDSASSSSASKKKQKSGSNTEKTPLVLWFSPEPRCVFPLENELHWSRSLRRTLRIHPYEVTIDQDFAGVMHMCGETRANATWIIPELERGYRELHRLGWAHSVEVWESTTSTSTSSSNAIQGRELVGGIYGVAIGGLFAGESMFHTRTDASKIAFATLATKLRRAGYQLFDVQVTNPHLASLGCKEIPRREYLARLDHALRVSPRLDSDL